MALMVCTACGIKSGRADRATADGKPIEPSAVAVCACDQRPAAISPAIHVINPAKSVGDAAGAGRREAGAGGGGHGCRGGTGGGGGAGRAVLPAGIAIDAAQFRS
jgi:hypothetical protein